MDQELMYKATFLHKQLEEMQQSLEFIDNELKELQKYRDNLNYLRSSKDDSLIASIGKGIHAKARLESKDLYVEVGAGIVVKKSPEEAIKIIEDQVKKLSEARMQVYAKMEVYEKTLNTVMTELDDMNAAANSS